jgi:hypothetical protein
MLPLAQTLAVSCVADGGKAAPDEDEPELPLADKLPFADKLPSFADKLLPFADKLPSFADKLPPSLTLSAELPTLGSSSLHAAHTTSRKQINTILICFIQNIPPFEFAAFLRRIV